MTGQRALEGGHRPPSAPSFSTLSPTGGWVKTPSFGYPPEVGEWEGGGWYEQPPPPTRADGRTRTYDTRIKSPALYQLSYVRLATCELRTPPGWIRTNDLAPDRVAL